MPDSNLPLVSDPEALLGHSGQPLFRESQLAEIRGCLLGKLAAVRPIHAWVHGSPGAGKTFCVQYLLGSEAKEAGYLPVYVNCRERFTFLSVVESILDAVKPLRSPQRSRGRQLAILIEEFSSRRAVVALDEIDVLPEQDVIDLFHSLTALPQTSVISIASSRQALLKLPEAVRSRLAPRQIVFPRYKPEEALGILVATAERALSPKAWTKEPLQKIVDHSYGDARRSLALLRHAVQRAEEARASVLEAEHLIPANFRHFHPDVEDELALLSSHHQLLYELVCSLEPVSGIAADREYRQACEHKSKEPVSPRSVHKYLTQLCQLRILARERGARTLGWIYRVAKS